MLEVKVKLTHPKASLPAYTRPGDAKMDIRTIEDYVLEPGETHAFRTGVKLQDFPEGWRLDVTPRSGLAAKHSLFVVNSPGCVDENYRGEILVIIYNGGDTSFVVNQGDRIAQVSLERVNPFVFSLSNEEVITERGENGFNSSGVK